MSELADRVRDKLGCHLEDDEVVAYSREDHFLSLYGDAEVSEVELLPFSTFCERVVHARRKNGSWSFAVPDFELIGDGEYTW